MFKNKNTALAICRIVWNCKRLAFKLQFFLKYSLVCVFFFTVLPLWWFATQKTLQLVGLVTPVLNTHNLLLLESGKLSLHIRVLHLGVVVTTDIGRAVHAPLPARRIRALHTTTAAARTAQEGHRPLHEVTSSPLPRVAVP